MWGTVLLLMRGRPAWRGLLVWSAVLLVRTRPARSGLLVRSTVLLLVRSRPA
ncbi:hypothetical protein AB0F68_25970 [Micromonospora sp. NPDC023966]|uniref:hypothetical protein n=1 Tax=Micromonospora sp. NPDC023966 TaxID=3154699 RepID=UPI0033EE1E56